MIASVQFHINVPYYTSRTRMFEDVRKEDSHSVLTKTGP